MRCMAVYMCLRVRHDAVVLTSRCVGGRKPFGQDVEIDYEVMSDQDWEEEPEGESLSVSVGHCQESCSCACWQCHFAHHTY